MFSMTQNVFKPVLQNSFPFSLFAKEYMISKQLFNTIFNLFRTFVLSNLGPTCGQLDLGVLEIKLRLMEGHGGKALASRGVLLRGKGSWVQTLPSTGMVPHCVQEGPSMLGVKQQRKISTAPACRAPRYQEFSVNGL